MKDGRYVYAIDADSYAEGAVIVIGIGIVLALVGVFIFALLLVPMAATSLISLPDKVLYGYWRHVGKKNTVGYRNVVGRRLGSHGRYDEAKAVLRASELRTNKTDRMLTRIREIQEKRWLSRWFSLRGFALLAGVYFLSSDQGMLVAFGTITLVGIFASVLYEGYKVYGVIRLIRRGILRNKTGGPQVNLKVADYLYRKGQVDAARYILYITPDKVASYKLAAMDRPFNRHNLQWRHQLIMACVWFTGILSIIMLAEFLIS